MCAWPADRGLRTGTDRATESSLWEESLCRAARFTRAGREELRQEFGPRPPSQRIAKELVGGGKKTGAESSFSACGSVRLGNPCLSSSTSSSPPLSVIPKRKHGNTEYPPNPIVFILGWKPTAPNVRVRLNLKSFVHVSRERGRFPQQTGAMDIPTWQDRSLRGLVSATQSDTNQLA